MLLFRNLGFFVAAVVLAFALHVWAAQIQHPLTPTDYRAISWCASHVLDDRPDDGYLSGLCHVTVQSTSSPTP